MHQVIGDVDKLITSVLHAARSKGVETTGEAEEEADRILAEAEQQAEAAAGPIRARAEAQAAEIRRRKGSAERRDARRAYLEAREELVQQASEETRTRLSNLVAGSKDDPSDYAAVLKELAREAAVVLDVDDIVLSSCSHGHELLTEDRLESWAEEAGKAGGRTIQFRRSEEHAEIDGGLIASDADGRRQVDNSFETRLALILDEERERIVDALRSDPGGAE